MEIKKEDLKSIDNLIDQDIPMIEHEFRKEYDRVQHVNEECHITNKDMLYATTISHVNKAYNQEGRYELNLKRLTHDMYSAMDFKDDFAKVMNNPNVDIKDRAQASLDYEKALSVYTKAYVNYRKFISKE